LADKYVVEELIGEGAMGRVYKARQRTLNKAFAAKILAPHLMHDEASQARFANEAHNAASLNHPNCVSVVDFGRTGSGLAFIVMEYIHGVTLERLIAEQHPLATDRIVDLVLQILSALTEAHGLRILHRDLKPENILIQQLRTHGELAKVLDFGIAKLVELEDDEDGGDTPEQRITRQGLVCGTPEYMSPEQTRGHKLDARSDLYSVGAILYQMIVGHPPFESESVVEVMHMQLHQKPTPPHEKLEGKPHPLEEVCLKALAKEPSLRFASAEEFRNAVVLAGAKRAGETIGCPKCQAAMKAEHRFCPSCGVAAPRRPKTYVGRRHPSRTTGMALPSTGSFAKPTAELVVRSFPMPLIGRDDQVRELESRLKNPGAGSYVRVFTGPPGAGKTRLVDEMAVQAERLQWRVLYAGADPTGARTPLWPIRCMVAQVLGLDLTTMSTQALGRAASLAGLTFEELPGLAELLELHGPAHDLEFGARRRECFASATQAMLAAANRQPALLIFDDLDLYDTPSREVIRRLASAQSTDPLLILCTSAEPNLEWLPADIDPLPPLRAEQVEQVSRDAIIEVQPNSRLPAELAKMAPISPLKLESHLRLLSHGERVPPETSTLKLIHRRLKRLDDHALGILETASVLGERFLESDLVSLIERDTGVPVGSDFDRSLAKLHIDGVLIIVGNGERVFSHALLQEAAYANLTAERRRRLHRFAAQSSRIAQSSITVRATHLLHAGSLEAIEALMEASERAERTFDDPVAGAYIEAGLDACRRLSDANLRGRYSVELTLHAARVMRTGEAARRCLSLVTDQLQVEHEPAQEAELRLARARLLSQCGQTEQLESELKRALSAAIGSDDRQLIMNAYSALGSLHANQGQLDQALGELQEGLDLFTLGEGPRAPVDFGIWRYLLRMAEILRASNRIVEAQTVCEDALYQAERTGNRLGLLRGHSLMAWITRDAKQASRAEQHLARALDEARHFGDRLTTVELLIERARARAGRGRLQEARRCCEEALRLARGINWSAGVAHAERAIGMLTNNTPPAGTPSPSERSGARPIGTIG
jgi:serine/threonine-protein kinase